MKKHCKTSCNCEKIAKKTQNPHEITANDLRCQRCLKVGKKEKATFRCAICQDAICNIHVKYGKVKYINLERDEVAFVFCSDCLPIEKQLVKIVKKYIDIEGLLRTKRNQLIEQVERLLNKDLEKLQDRKDAERKQLIKGR